jgi:hypothetical protein
MTDQASTPSPTRFVYVYTSNGDWMDMTPQGEDHEPCVDVLAVELDDPDDLYDAADQAEGLLLGTLVIRNGRPVILGPDADHANPGADGSHTELS